MAVWGKRSRSTTRHEYVMPDPVNAAEFGKAYHAASEEYSHLTGKGVADDSIWGHAQRRRNHHLLGRRKL